MQAEDRDGSQMAAMRVIGAILTRPRLWVAVGLFATGLAIYAATSDPFESLGLALAIAMVVAVTTDALVGEEILGRVRTAVKRVDEALTRLGIVNQAQAAGVYGIYMRYTPDEEGEQAIRKALEAQLTSSTGEFRVMGVAAPCLFADNQSRLIFQKHMPNSETKVRAILVDSESQWADVRAGLERGHTTKKDIGTAFDYLDWMRGQWGDKIAYMKSNIPLPAFVVITHEWAFVEPYPIAEVKGRPLGGSMPLLKLESATAGYQIWSETFELLWRYPQHGDLHGHAEHLSRYGQPPSGHQ